MRRILSGLREWRNDRRSDWKIGFEPYLSAGTANCLRVRGRVLRHPGRYVPAAGDSKLKNLRAAWHRFESDEVENARVLISFEGVETEAVSDREGYIDTGLELKRPATAGWNTLEIRFKSLPYGASVHDSYEAACLVPDPQADFGVISDIDDTILVTDVTRRSRMLTWSLFHNEHSRLPLDGAAELYAEISRAGSVERPFFYVSNSPWNLYQMIERFIEGSRFPLGPVYLRDFGISGKRERSGHKARTIRKLLESYPELPIVLVGDAGEHDAEIYAGIVDDFPKRVIACYIRQSEDELRNELRAAAERCTKRGVPMSFVQESKEISEDLKLRIPAVVAD